MSEIDEQFNELVHEEYPKLFAASTLIVSSPAIAEEIVQDCLEKTYLKWKRISRYDRPGAWVRRIVINASLSHVRKRKSEAETLIRLASESVVHSDELWLTHDGLWREVGTLPDQQATVIALHYGADVSIADISIELELTEPAVKSLLYRARTALRDNDTVKEIAR